MGFEWRCWGGNVLVSTSIYHRTKERCDRHESSDDEIWFGPHVEVGGGGGRSYWSCEIVEKIPSLLP